MRESVAFSIQFEGCPINKKEKKVRKVNFFLEGREMRAKIHHLHAQYPLKQVGKQVEQVAPNDSLTL
jgi:hypothetical protein